MIDLTYTHVHTILKNSTLYLNKYEEYLTHYYRCRRRHIKPVPINYPKMVNRFLLVIYERRALYALCNAIYSFL